MSSIFSLLFVAILSGCLPEPSSVKSDVNFNSKIISGRPQNWEQFIAVIQLKNASFFEASKVAAGNILTKENTLHIIEVEQNKAIENLRRLPNGDKIQILYRYRFVLNGLAIIAPKSLEARIKNLHNVSFLEQQQIYHLPNEYSSSRIPFRSFPSLAENNSSSFVGAYKIHHSLGTSQMNENGQRLQLLHQGQGIKVGIIDSGVDYTHKMLGGSGIAGESFLINGDVPNALFPNKKIVGGVDLVGYNYNPDSPHFEHHIPIPDSNPFDEKGHGTRVASIIAGVGDGEFSYTGVAPQSDIYAIKVFGADGSTSQVVVLAALEYAADPNGDSNPNDHLDVLNLSLGSSFGAPSDLYELAINNLAKANIVVVASAGNSFGRNQNIVGSPSTAKEAISVAASVDYMDHNWKNRTISFNYLENGERKEVFEEAIEALFSRSIGSLSGDCQGNLVYVGKAVDELDLETSQNVFGNIALIDRGGSDFFPKIRRVQKAGAIAAVVVNDVSTFPIQMSEFTGADIPIPAVMITKSLGERLKKIIQDGKPVLSNFINEQVVEHPEMIDSMADFSSRGPRITDAMIKPEITAPGLNIMTAQMGTGDRVSVKSGTSFAAPFITGIVALLKQKNKNFSVDQIKSLLMGPAKILKKKNKQRYAISRQGAGRIMGLSSLNSSLVTTPYSISLGEIKFIEGDYRRSVNIKIKNISNKEKYITIDTISDKGIQIDAPKKVIQISSNSEYISKVNFYVSSTVEGVATELNGFIFIREARSDEVLSKIPILALASQTSNIAYESYEETNEDVVVNLENISKFKGEALLFNLLGQDITKNLKNNIQYFNPDTECDLVSAGYRTIEKTMDSGLSFPVLQIAVKLKNQVSSWRPCHVSMLIDSDEDEIAEQELVGLFLDDFKGLQGRGLFYYDSLLLDARRMIEGRRIFENGPQIRQNYITIPNEEDYRSAIFGSFGDGGMKVFNHSTIAIIQVRTDLLKKIKEDKIKIKIVVSNENRGRASRDDYLSNNLLSWLEINLNAKNQPYYDLRDIIVEGKSKVNVEFKKNNRSSQGQMIIYYPNNHPNSADFNERVQSQVFRP